MEKPRKWLGFWRFWSRFFVGYQLKRANNIAEAEAIASIYSEINEVALAIANDSELARLFYQGLSDPELLSTDELGRFLAVWEALINVTEMAWKNYDKGIVSEKDANFYVQDLCAYIGNHPRHLDAWKSNEQRRIPGFYNYVKGTCDL